MSYSEFANMGSVGFAIYAIISLLYTFVGYCTIPIILRFTLVKKRHLEKSTLVAISTGIAVAAFILFRYMAFIMDGTLEIKSTTFSPAVIWGFVSFWILRSGDLKYHSDVKEGDGKIVVYDTTYSYAPLSNTTPTESPAEAAETQAAPAETPVKVTETPKPDDAEKDKPVTEKAAEAADNIPSPEALPALKNAKAKAPSKKLIIALSCLCVVFAISTVALLAASISSSNEQALQKEIWDAKPYQRAAEYYLDNAVVVIDGDDTYYHREYCPAAPEDYSYWIYNIEAVENDYEKCPVCFGYDRNEYIERYF